MNRVRCSIYTRKSSEEGLEQSFNSLDAQREACSAYILSQASEGWSETGQTYDDGGLSGGTLERPALKRLLADIAEGRVDIVVVYKVDRLTRSLLDFSKLVEAFDKAGTSFVSVTQSFNTTTSMGRLTLNMLLSFAQFEREVTAERIRDKIAASKAKGMWMGGTPPIGYAPDGRSLKIVEEHAGLVCDIFRRYLALGNVRLVQDALRAENIRVPNRTRLTGSEMGGGQFSRGQLYTILRNATYVGEVFHKGVTYPGLQPPIIERDTWDAVQLQMSEQRQGTKKRVRAASPSLLAGLIRDANGEPLIASHASKGTGTAKQRYCYYVSRALNEGVATEGMRIPAREIEQAVCCSLAELFGNPLDLIGRGLLQVSPTSLPAVVRRSEALVPRLEKRERELVRGLISDVMVHDGRIELTLRTAAIADALGAELASGADATVTLTSAVRLTRSGLAMRLVRADGRHVGPAPNASMLKLVAQGHAWWKELRKGELDITRLAARERVTTGWMTRVVRLAFLSPELTCMIVKGHAPVTINARAVVGTEFVQPDWEGRSGRSPQASARGRFQATTDIRGNNQMVEIESIVLQVIGEAPEWLRRDLTSSDSSARRRAEETLATRIEAALAMQAANSPSS